MKAPAPKTRGKRITALPPIRPNTCAKCPFGTGLDFWESLQAEALKDRLRSNPDIVWGCHETAGSDDSTVSNKTLRCPGALAWKETL